MFDYSLLSAFISCTLSNVAIYNVAITSFSFPFSYSVVTLFPDLIVLSGLQNPIIPIPGTANVNLKSDKNLD